MMTRVLRVLALVWLAWYIAGPLCETVDTWDAPHEELRDIAFNAGGALGMMAAAVLAAAALLRRLRQLARAAVESTRRGFPAVSPLEPRGFLPHFPLLADHSPPVYLRI